MQALYPYMKTLDLKICMLVCIIKIIPVLEKSISIPLKVQEMKGSLS